MEAMYLQIFELTESISAFGYLKVFVASLILAVIALWKLNTRLNDRTHNTVHTTMSNTMDMYQKMMTAQEIRCREDSEILRGQINATKDELRIYKNKDKIMVAKFMDRTSESNKSLVESNKILVESNKKIIEALNLISEAINIKK